MRRGIVAVLVTAGLACSAADAHGDPPYGGTGVRTLQVPSETMVPTIPAGGRVDANYRAYDRAEPQLLDIVIVNPPAAAERYYGRLARYCGDRHRRTGQMCARARPGLSKVLYIKRIVGLPGDRLSLRKGRLFRNGVALAEPYTAACADRELCRFPRTITVPAGRYYVMGDNRGASYDSRLWGPVPRRAIVARVDRCRPQPAVGCDPRS